MIAPSIPDWINAAAAAVGALALVLGLLGANRTIAENRRTARELRRSQVAEELIALSFNADDAIRHMRAMIDSVPADKTGDRLYSLQKRYERVAEYNELFRSLRDAQIRVRAVLGDSEVDKAVETLFDARSRVALAIEFLADYARDQVSELDQKEREEMRNFRRDLYGNYSEADELGKKIITAVKTVESRLSPVARLEATR